MLALPAVDDSASLTSYPYPPVFPVRCPPSCHFFFFLFFAGTGEGESSRGIEEGLAWLRDFFRREAAESKAEASVTVGDAEREQEPLDQAQREIGVKRCVIERSIWIWHAGLKRARLGPHLLK